MTIATWCFRRWRFCYQTLNFLRGQVRISNFRRVPFQVSLQKINDQGPRKIGGVGVVSRRAGIDVAVPTEWKKMPLQRLAVFFERLPHLFLRRDDGSHIVGAV